MRGPLFVTFEGGEGSGKSTQVKLLMESLAAAGVDAVTYREPGGTPGAEDIRALLLAGTKDRWTPTTEALLMSASRADLIHKCIRPALAANKIVVCDRFADSTIAYQGFGHGLGYDAAQTLNEFTTGGLQPDLTFVFLLDPTIGMARVSKRGTQDRYESFDLDFHTRVQDGYREVLARNPGRCIAVDATQSIDAIAQMIWERVGALSLCEKRAFVT